MTLKINENEMIFKIIEMALSKNVSDIHCSVGSNPSFRINGKITSLIDFPILKKEHTEEFAKVLLKERYQEFIKNKQLDFSYSIEGKGRFRINVFYQRDSISLVIRILNSQIPTMDELRLPNVLKDLTQKKSGLILVTGPTGSGKSTTLASMINYINSTNSSHILTLEDPIEYLHKNKKSIINQREIHRDVNSFPEGLRVALRQDPDVILIGEMRDLETISTALTASETGHLVLASLHTTTASNTIERIIDVFPANQQQQIKIQLASVLQAIICQRLVPTINNDRTLALEILIKNKAVENLIREGKTHQLQNVIQTNRNQGMITMNSHLQNLYNQNIINQEILQTYTTKQSF